MDIYDEECIQEAGRLGKIPKDFLQHDAELGELHRRNFRKAVNRLLPQTIRIRDVEEAPLDFHPQFHARRKTYQYRMFRDEVCCPFVRRFVHHHPYPLNEAVMMEAAPLFEGRHDFTAFAASDESDQEKPSKVRTIYSSVIERGADTLVYTIAGSGFLKHMVRNMVGTLVETGRGNLSLADVRRRLEPGCGIRPGPTAPASGLVLISVEYDSPDPNSRDPVASSDSSAP